MTYDILHKTANRTLNASFKTFLLKRESLSIQSVPAERCSRWHWLSTERLWRFWRRGTWDTLRQTWAVGQQDFDRRRWAIIKSSKMYWWLCWTCKARNDFTSQCRQTWKWCWWVHNVIRWNTSLEIRYDH